ncbi:hypothetical protein QYH69_16270 [Paraburkholderia sp. SARCC-3016]|uniref:hypothetical protein n=1 Tax=Paraburkholderia sp. SARCC-3016 TaxID=3058611 RepID=UPI00280A05D1|nr:hypothetical protein [Paraburkholderia sp. SARCC-3016]MDQ7978804.1 hypothetical protein [Paraburkholderia sp. SARCC-3016]
MKKQARKISAKSGHNLRAQSGTTQGHNRAQPKDTTHARSERDQQARNESRDD